MTEVHKCSICEAEYSGFGNNAAPFDGRCCDQCNWNVVIPARMGEPAAVMLLKEKLKEKVQR